MDCPGSTVDVRQLRVIRLRRCITQLPEPGNASRNLHGHGHRNFRFSGPLNHRYPDSSTVILASEYLGGDKERPMVKNKKFEIPARYIVRANVLVAALGFVCLFSVSARAQGTSTPLTRIDVSAAYSYVNAGAADSGGTFNVHGGSGSVAYNLNNWVGLAADVGGYHFTTLPAGLGSNMYTYLFGPRFSFRNSGRITPFAQVLFGGGRVNASSGGIQAGENGFARLSVAALTYLCTATFRFASCK